MRVAMAECAPLDNVIRPGEPNGPSGVALIDRRFVGQINFRARGGAATAAGAALGYALPVEANTTVGNGVSRACWLGPDEWLILCEYGQKAELLKRLNDTLSGQAYAATDITDARAVLRLAGSCARPVLAKGCPLDLHPRGFGPGKVAQSVLAKAQVMILPVEDGYDLFVARSFAAYIWAWLIDAGAEYGIRIEA
jgi:sarcosine oxidase subunit gamma